MGSVHLFVCVGYWRSSPLTFHNCNESVFPPPKRSAFNLLPDSLCFSSCMLLSLLLYIPPCINWQLILPAVYALIYWLPLSTAIGADSPRRSLRLDLLHLNPSICYVNGVWPDWTFAQQNRHSDAHQNASLLCFRSTHHYSTCYLFAENSAAHVLVLLQLTARRHNEFKKLIII